uniref:Uncharacterized protein AlNc14C208G8871 n=1 Tax=Albugo laibachii Nc14 TaxID=890382 RepID=F0WR63_9STRA|nr:conserved hypothetical protein [Albugo laibachii Nc14]|eukprot:CCA23823.1 conserved hypothetical protein [Albugo laibachii Nc14]
MIPHAFLSTPNASPDKRMSRTRLSKLRLNELSGKQIEQMQEETRPPSPLARFTSMIIRSLSPVEVRPMSPPVHSGSFDIDSEQGEDEMGSDMSDNEIDTQSQSSAGSCSFASMEPIHLEMSNSSHSESESSQVIASQGSSVYDFIDVSDTFTSILDDQKREEIWVRYKKAEESLARSISTISTRSYRLDDLLTQIEALEVTEDGQLDSLLNSLRLEISLLRHDQFSSDSGLGDGQPDYKMHFKRQKSIGIADPGAESSRIGVTGWRRKPKEFDSVVSLNVRHRQKRSRIRVFTAWRMVSQASRSAKRHAFQKIAQRYETFQLRVLARCFRKLQLQAVSIEGERRENEWHHHLREARRGSQASSMQNGCNQLTMALSRWKFRQERRAFRRLQDNASHCRLQLSLFTRAETNMAKVLNRQQSLQLHKAFHRLRENSLCAKLVGVTTECDAHKTSMTEAKECVFLLSRAKTKLEDQMDEMNQKDIQLRAKNTKQADQLRLVKNLFLTICVIKKADNQFLHHILRSWQTYTVSRKSVRALSLELDLTRGSVAERDQRCTVLEDCNRVLRTELERSQLACNDKKIAVEALSKRILRDEVRVLDLEEEVSRLDERYTNVQSRLEKLLEWNTVVLPAPFVSLSKDICIDNLRQFLQHAKVSTSLSDETPPRISFDTMLSTLQVSSLVKLKSSSPEMLREKLMAWLPSNSTDISFTEYLVALNGLVNEIFASDPARESNITEFWASILMLATSSMSRIRFRERLHGTKNNFLSSRASWVNGLSDGILQNQEKFLTLLEHETEVVERTFMEESPLKRHPPTSSYESQESNLGSSVIENDTVDKGLEVDSGVYPNSDATMKSDTSPFSQSNKEMHDWKNQPQVHDLWLAFQRPLMKLWSAYATLGTECKSQGISLGDACKMMMDLKLLPEHLPLEFVHQVFRDASGDCDATLNIDNFMVLLGACGLKLYRKSPESLITLSPREIILSFFMNLGFLAESDIQHIQRVCIVGQQAEMVLWPLFEYYSGASASTVQRSRIGMTEEAFSRFVGEIDALHYDPIATPEALANTAKRVLSYVIQDPKVGFEMHFEQFYVAIAALQSERSQSIKHKSLGDAVREWMQQTNEPERSDCESG